jgi:ACS family sodium-dependent inorganic phosphate cotransporter
VTAVFGSLDVGSVIGLLVCGPLIRSFGWPSVFYLFALLGLLWCLAWPLLKPEEADTSVPYSAPPATVSGTPSVTFTLLINCTPIYFCRVLHILQPFVL